MVTVGAKGEKLLRSTFEEKKSGKKKRKVGRKKEKFWRGRGEVAEGGKSGGGRSPGGRL